MLNRHHNRKLVGLGALLGLWVMGCQSGPPLSRSNASPTSQTGTTVARQPGPLSRAVQLLRPRGTYESNGAVRTAAAVSIQTPVVRASAPDGNSRVVVASSWRPLQRGPASYDPPALIGDLTPPTPRMVSSVPNRVSAEAPRERLAMPRTVDGMAPPVGALALHPHGPVGYDGTVPKEGRKAALPPYVIEPPDILLIQLYRTGEGVPQAVDGQHLVRPDGTVNLGTYGSARLGGLTLDEARAEVMRVLNQRFDKTPLQLNEINVDVIAYNSKVYYVITDGGGYGEQVYRLPITGSETVLDAVGQIGGLPTVSSKKKIWVARPNLGHPHAHEVLPVNWNAVAQCASTATNYQLAPGDRVYVQSNPLIKFNSRLTQFLAPIQQSLGVTLLGSSTVNSIKGRGAFGGAGTGLTR